VEGWWWVLDRVLKPAVVPGKRDGPLAHAPLMRHFLGNLMATK
jgi:hypothetical protein